MKYPTDVDNFTSKANRGATSVNNIDAFKEAKIVTALGVYANAVFAAMDANSAQVEHRLATGDRIVLTSIGDATSGTVDKLTVGTTYYVHKSSDTTFGVADTKAKALSNTVIDTGNATGGVIQYYSLDGIYTGGELTEVTNTIYDFAEWIRDDVPATSTFGGNGLLARVGKEITAFYDAIDARRGAVSVLLDDTTDVLATVAADGTTRTEHGLTVGEGVRFRTSVGNIVGDNGVFYGTQYFVTPIKAAATHANETITLVAHGLVTDDRITVTSTSAACGLTAGTTYRVVKTGADTFTLKTIAGVAVLLDTNDADVYFTTPKAFAIADENGLFDLGDSGLINMWRSKNAFTAKELAYIANMDSINFNDLIKEAEKFGARLKKLTAHINKVNETGSLGTSLYPSGKQNGYN